MVFFPGLHQMRVSLLWIQQKKHWIKHRSCREHYHMACLQPPLLAKPAKGYSWVCPSCFYQPNTQPEGQKLLLLNNSSGTGKLKAARTKIKSDTLDFTPDTMFRGWPWRYFGYDSTALGWVAIHATRTDHDLISIYTIAEDTLGNSATLIFAVLLADSFLDPEDAIFPRAATRVGSKYQANVPLWREEHRHQDFDLYPEAKKIKTQHASSVWFERGHSPGERKHEYTIELWSAPSDDCMSLPLVSLLCN